MWWISYQHESICLALELTHPLVNCTFLQVTQFFSYEHFYVLFCRFYELDSDRDNRLSRENLLKYGDHALSSAIVDRIFEVSFCSIISIAAPT